MAPSHLQGLNIVHPSPPATPYNVSDADLLSIPPFPDFNAQLDLWTHLNFQSDEPLGLPLSDSAKKHTSDLKSRRTRAEDDADRYNEQDDDVSMRAGIAEATAHENVVTGTVLPPTGVAHNGHPTSSNDPGASIPFDIGSILAGMGIDPFLVPPVQQAPAPPAPMPTAHSLAQLLSLHAASLFPPPNASVMPRPPTSVSGQPQQQRLVPPPLQQSQQQPQPQSQPQPPQQKQQQQPQQQTTPAPASKRARTAGRASFSSVASPESVEAEEKESGTPMTASEDKRRRNTAASARFRLKKKEREAALERKAKELEVRVSELEKECEALRRENGWLKGLVVGVTGVGAVQQQVGTGGGTKRSREDSEGPREEQQE
ncbi:uncharacterized protein FIBRA_01065 [Fibroporia radiculosa]|uniref:BZIP domain-containing protein n=1 Tax=Fibroporia radiculosa TaxID=599839 RepID=J4H0W4_9APHY|nr:uncharacterized protein FIBRA_01065 [Fibroporia radiculosa]CCL99054.1 predicted protein [Fibroporia radiculosa]